MKNVYIYCEGQTEEAFVNQILSSYFFRFDIFVIPIICSTKRTVNKKYKGGAVNYDKIKLELSMICRQHKNEVVTTMFDYYAMPGNTPSISYNEPDIYKRMEIIEQAVNEDIGAKNLFFHFMLHEFEGLLFSDPQAFKVIADDNTVSEIQSIRNEFPTPEHINTSVETAPSKRIYKLIPNYSKVTDGCLISEEIGIDKMMTDCKHFRDWIHKIKNR